MIYLFQINFFNLLDFENFRHIILDKNSDIIFMFLNKSNIKVRIKWHIALKRLSELILKVAK